MLREVDSALQGSDRIVEDVRAEPIDPTDVEPEPLEEESYPVGSKCRFRYMDGRWYNGQVVAVEGSDSARISFLTPTSEKMLVCRYCFYKISKEGKGDS